MHMPCLHISQCFLNFVCRQVTDVECDGDENLQCSHLASQALHVLPFYSLLSSDRQAKVCVVFTYMPSHYLRALNVCIYGSWPTYL